MSEDRFGVGEIRLGYYGSVWYDNSISKVLDLLESGSLTIPNLMWKKESRGSVIGWRLWINLISGTEEQALTRAKNLRDIMQLYMDTYG